MLALLAQRSGTHTLNLFFNYKCKSCSSAPSGRVKSGPLGDENTRNVHVTERPFALVELRARAQVNFDYDYVALQLIMPQTEEKFLVDTPLCSCTLLHHVAAPSIS